MTTTPVAWMNGSVATYYAADVIAAGHHDWWVITKTTDGWTVEHTASGEQQDWHALATLPLRRDAKAFIERDAIDRLTAEEN